MFFVYQFILLTSAVVLLIVCLNKRKAVRILPYVLLFYMDPSLPLFRMLHNIIFIKLFGIFRSLGLSIRELDMNDRQRIMFNVGTVLMVILGIVVSKDFKSRILRVVYNVAVLLVNVALTLLVCRFHIWE